MSLLTIYTLFAIDIDKGFFDIFSTAMMLLELIWIEDLMDSNSNIQVAVSFTRVSKASRFAKIGARSTKIIKLFRLIKLIRFFKSSNDKGTSNTLN